jgi:hypothetical protein
LELGLLALLFLSQGPVFPNLIFPAIIMVVGLSNKNTLVSVLLVALAAYIASIDRFHWGFGLPALAALFSGLKQERLESSIWKSLQQPAIVVSAGLIGALAFNRWRILPGLVRNSQNYSAPIFFGIAVVFILIFLLYRYSALRLRRWVNYGIAFGVLFLFITTGYQLLIYIPNSGSLQQELLWFRWLPNPTFPPGILLALLLATGPAILLLFIAYRRNHWRLNKIQIVVTSSVCLTLLAVGLVASAKIGGGGDLHNLDLFLLAILFAASVGWPHIQKLKEDWKEQPRLLLATYLLLAAPVFYLCFFVPAGPLKLPPPAEIESALETIQESVAQAQTKGEILFMDQRQLLTFGYVENVPLVDDYEKKRVMDEALSANASYFRDFYSDLENHRFSLIVSEILFIRTGNLENPFPEENDAWVYWVAEPMLDYYMPLITLRSVGVQLLVPRSR